MPKLSYKARKDLIFGNSSQKLPENTGGVVAALLKGEGRPPWPSRIDVKVLWEGRYRINVWRVGVGIIDSYFAKGAGESYTFSPPLRRKYEDQSWKKTKGSENEMS